jgi:hypothetical protein
MPPQPRSQPSDVGMDPQAVNQNATGMAALVGEAKARTKGLLDPSGTASAEHPHWLSSAALTRCREAWEGQVDSLVDRANGMAAALRASAEKMTALAQRNEQAVEQKLKPRIESVLRTMSTEPPSPAAGYRP